MSDLQPKFFPVPDLSAVEQVAGIFTIGVGGLILFGSIFELGAVEGTICGAAGALGIAVPVWCYQRLRDRTDTAHEANALVIANKAAGDEYVAQRIGQEREQFQLRIDYAEGKIAHLTAERDAARALLPARDTKSGRFLPKQARLPGVPVATHSQITIEGTVE